MQTLHTTSKQREINFVKTLFQCFSVVFSWISTQLKVTAEESFTGSSTAHVATRNKLRVLV